MSVRLEKRDGIAVVTIDNLPVNAMGRAVRQHLWEIAGALEEDAGIRAVVLTGAGRLFVGGADISEFDREPEPPHLPDLLARIEAAAKPWIAAMHGVSMGGGVEISLACRFRVAAPDGRFALPEVNLGLIPGSGGTQRLPRLVGVDAALPMVAENVTLNAARALEIGFLDHLIEGDLVEGAVAFAHEVLATPLPERTRDRAVNDPGPEFWQAAEARVARSAKGLKAPLLAVGALRHGVENGFEKGLAYERETFLQLKAGDESAALRYLFFAERAAPRPADLKSITPRPIASAGVVGGGTMGVGIAAALRNAGVPVILSERDDAALERALKALEGVFAAAVKRGLITQADAAARIAGVKGVVGLAPLDGCDLVVEAVFEELSVKRAVFAELADLCRPDAILATNTSYIDPRLIFADLPGQERFIGLHFFSPAQVMKLLEIVPLPDTATDVLAAAFDLARKLGKVPVQAGICDGFIGNRILRRSRAEMDAMVRDGTPHVDIDAAMRRFGYPMGPFEMQDMAGLDISFLHREAARARGEDVPETPGDILVRAGRTGQKSGGGWYDYAAGDRKPINSGEVERLIAPLCAPARRIEPEAIARRLVDAMADEGRKVLAEGIAARPEDIDLVKVHGYGFPRGKGGPMFLAARGNAAGSAHQDRPAPARA